MASTPFERRMRRLDRNALDLPVAGLFALAILFVAFAMPGDLLAELVGATGLPSLLPAAEPPLGLTARAAIGLVGAGIGFGLVFYLLRLIDRSLLASAKPRPFAPLVEEAPKPRRRDAHPDAPAPRPLSAWRELGEPAPPRHPAPVAKPEPAPAPAPEPEIEIEREEPEAEELVLEPEVKRATPDWMADPDSEAQAEPVARAPRPRPAPRPASRPEPVVEAAAPEPEAEPVVPEESEESLPELMARLEAGIARRRTRPAAPPVQPQVFPEAPDDRLQSAIDSLQRLAARHN